MSRLARSLAQQLLVDAHGSFGTSAEEAIVPREHVGSTLDLAGIYREHAAQVATWARRLLGPHGDVEDALQEVFLVAHRRLAEYRGEAKITTWLHEITFRVTQNQRRKLRFTSWLRLPPFMQEDPVDARTPHHALESRRAWELAYRAFDKLSEAERTALILFEIDGLPAEEISNITGHTVGTVWVHLSRGRKRFREAFTRLEQTKPFTQGGAPR